MLYLIAFQQTQSWYAIITSSLYLASDYITSTEMEIYVLTKNLHTKQFSVWALMSSFFYSSLSLPLVINYSRLYHLSQQSVTLTYNSK